MEGKINNLFRIVEHTAALTAKVHGVFNKDEIFRIVVDELKKAEGYEMALMLLSEDRKEFILELVSLSEIQIKAIEKVIGTKVIGYRRPYELVKVFHRAVQNQETYSLPSNQFIEQLLDGGLGKTVTLITGHSRKTSAFSPIVIGNKVVGVLGIDTPQEKEFQETFELIVKNLAKHISMALELALHHEKRTLAEENLKGIFENTKDAIASIDQDGNVIAWNQAAEEMFGYSQNEILGKSYDILVPKELKEDRTQMLEQAKKQGYVVNYESVRKRKNGNRFTVEMTVSVSSTSNGANTYTAIIRDVTARKLAEKNLLVRNRAMDAANQGIVITDPNLNDNPIIDCNKTFERLTGYSKQEILGKNCRLLQGPDSNPVIVQEIKDAVRNEQDYACEIINYKKDGTPFWNELVITGVRNSKGELLNYIGMQADITSRKEARTALEESEFLLKQTHRIAGIGSYKLNFKTGVWTSSELLDEIFGIENIYERNVEGWLQLVHPDQQNELKDYLENEVIEKQTRFDKEYRIVKNNDKQQRWVHGIGELEFDAEGALIGMKGVIRDITEGKEAMNRVNEMADKFRAVFESSSAGMVVVADNQGIIQEWNSGAVKAFGYSKEEAIGLDLKIIVPERFRARHDAGFRHAIKTNALLHKGLPLELVGLRKDGSEFPIEFAVSTWQSNGKTLFSANMHDITERKRASNRLRELSVAVEQSPASLVITDLKGNIKYVNPKFEEVTGFAAKKVIGKNPRLLKSGHTSPEEYEKLWKTISSGKTWTGEFHNKKRDGTLYWEKASIGPIFNEEGEIKEYLAVKEDITEIKETQHMLRDTLVHLEDLVDQRTSELTAAKSDLERTHQDFMSSLHYAQRIQQASLPTNAAFNQAFSDSFVLFRPKDIVSGDFYWLFSEGENVILSLVDCTGHGVPGALMAMAGNEHLSNVVIKERCFNPKEILEELDQSVSRLLKKRNTSHVVMDGMDLSVVYIDKVNHVLEYSSAQGHGLLIRADETIILSPDKHSIGGFTESGFKTFTLQKYAYSKGDRLYLFSDGIYDQFGGPRVKKLLRKNFIKVILDTSKLDLQQQAAHLEQFFIEWLGDNVQIDDVSLIGVEF